MSSNLELPVIDVDIFLSQPRDSLFVQKECKKAAEALIDYGVIVVHDSRIPADANETFLTMLEDYFCRPRAEILRDERPESHWQIGVTPDFKNKPKCGIEPVCQDIVAKLKPSERPVDIMHRPADPNMRFFWRIARRLPYTTEYPELNPTNVLPEAEEFRGKWASVMDRWGGALRSSAEPLVQMLAIGLGIPEDTFIDASKYGPHILGPTASDLTKHNKKNDVLLGFHYDMNFMSIHGRSRFPSLHVWARNTGKRILVRIPKDGPYLLLQAGKQMEHFTGGLIKAGYHEVVINDATLEAIEKRKVMAVERPLIRISSTLFYHLASDQMLAPITALEERAHALRKSLDESEDTYESMKVGEQVNRFAAIHAFFYCTRNSGLHAELTKPLRIIRLNGFKD